MKIHYATTFICNIACGKRSIYSKICKTCNTILLETFLDTTFNKSKVTCINCKRTKIFKNETPN